MLTGLEVTGVVLAILPLVVKQLEDYAKGLNTIRCFGARRHRREMNLYAAEVGTQAALLTDSIILLIEDIVEDIEVLSSNLHIDWLPILETGTTQQRLRKRLGRNYDLYMKTMQALSETLSDLQSKLGLDTAATSEDIIGHSKHEKFSARFKRLKDVFSKSIFDDLLARIDRANSTLKSLTESALREEESSRRRLLQKKPLLHFSIARRYAGTLHRAMLENSCWNCSRNHSHKLNLRIDDSEFSRIVDGESPEIIFNLALTTSGNKAATSTIESAWWGKELKIIPVKIDEAGSKQLSGLPPNQKHNSHKRVAFVLEATPVASTPMPTTGLSSVNLCERDLCSELVTRKDCISERERLGFFSKDFWRDHRHDVYLVRDLPRQQISQPLLQSIVEAQKAPLWQATRNSLKLWTNRLRIAVVLAFSVMKLHGTWLRPFWKLKDVWLALGDEAVLPTSKGQTDLQHLHLEWDNLQQVDLSQLSLCPSKSPLIRSDLLFPLGIALLELALCEPMESLLNPEDSDPIECVAELKAALRLIDAEIVALQCGQRYSDVVRDCLLWNGKKEADLDDATVQQLVWEKVVLPLIEDLCVAIGKTQA